MRLVAPQKWSPEPGGSCRARLLSLCQKATLPSWFNVRCHCRRVNIYLSRNIFGRKGCRKLRTSSENVTTSGERCVRWSGEKTICSSCNITVQLSPSLFQMLRNFDNDWSFQCGKKIKNQIWRFCFWAPRVNSVENVCTHISIHEILPVKQGEEREQIIWNSSGVRSFLQTTEFILNRSMQRNGQITLH